jgi:hypothetical protein
MAVVSPDTNILFATRNTRDFQDCGFARVWDPLSAGG